MSYHDRAHAPQEKENLTNSNHTKKVKGLIQPKQVIQHAHYNPIIQRARKENNTGIPDRLKTGAESLSGLSMNDVRVYYNSSKPAQVGALAYTQGTDIHVAQKQEKHLPHEVWHVVQQKQGRVKPTMRMQNAVINEDKSLEQEADAMGALSSQVTTDSSYCNLGKEPISHINPVIQMEKGKFTRMPDGTYERDGVIYNKIEHEGACYFASVDGKQVIPADKDVDIDQEVLLGGEKDSTSVSSAEPPMAFTSAFLSSSTLGPMETDEVSEPPAATLEEFKEKLAEAFNKDTENWVVENCGSHGYKAHKIIPECKHCTGLSDKYSAYITQDSSGLKTLDNVHTTKSYRDFPNKQVLRWLSTCIAYLLGIEQEVQCYFDTTGERSLIYISTNLQNDMKKLKRNLEGQTITAFITARLEKLEDLEKQGSRRQGRHSKELRALLDTPQEKLKERFRTIAAALGNVPIIPTEIDGNIHAETRINKSKRARAGKDGELEDTDALEPKNLGGLRRPCAVCHDLVHPGVAPLVDDGEQATYSGPFWITESALKPAFLKYHGNVGLFKQRLDKLYTFKSLEHDEDTGKDDLVDDHDTDSEHSDLEDR